MTGLVLQFFSHHIVSTTIHGYHSHHKVDQVFSDKAVFFLKIIVSLSVSVNVLVLFYVQ